MSSLRGIQRGRTPLPLTTACAPSHFNLLKKLFLKDYVMARQQTIMEKEIIAFKDSFPLTFSRVFAKLLATNCFRHLT